MRCPVIALFLSVLLVSPTLASQAPKTALIVIPISPQPDNVLTVGPTGAEYRDLRRALDSITDAGPDNPYFVHVATGEYDVGDAPLALKPYVAVIGAGVGETVVKGQLATSSAPHMPVIFGAEHARLERMTVRNDGGGYYVRTIVNDGTSPVLSNLDVQAAGGTWNTAIMNCNNAAPTIIDVAARARFGQYAFGIVECAGAHSTIRDSSAVAEGATDWGVAIELDDGATVLRDVTATAIGGESVCSGIRLGEGPAEITLVSARATGIGDCYGIDALGVAVQAVVRHSRLEGTSGGQRLVDVTLSTVINGGNGGSCTASVDGDGNLLDSDCDPVGN